MRISDWSSDVCSSDLLVFIGGADAASGGADLARAGGGFAQRVEVAVKGQDQRTIVGNREILGVDGNALLAQLGDLVAQRPRIAADAVADDRQRDRKSVVSGTRVSVRVDIGGRRLLKQKIANNNN